MYLYNHVELAAGVFTFFSLGLSWSSSAFGSSVLKVYTHGLDSPSFALLGKSRFHSPFQKVIKT